jgi:photosystem II stability/assembly factor-like uncharacterized protein
MNKLILASEHGLVICERDGNDWRESVRGLASQRITSVTAREGVILAGTRNGIFRSRDDGRNWAEASDGLAERHIRWMAFHPDVSDFEFAGTEPADIFISHNGGELWSECPEVPILRDQHQWSLPYSPEAGCVRGFAFHGSRAYAAVEVGGVLHSTNSGETWLLVEGSDGNPDLEGPPEPLIYPDVHSLEVHPSSPDLVYAPTGGGFYRSKDGGRTWNLFYDCYCRAVWVDPQDSEHLILGPADNVDSNGRIEESHDGGQSWLPASNGLNVPWRRGMVERFFQAGDELFAVLSNGQVLITSLNQLEWQYILPTIKNVNAITTMIE